MADNIKEKVRGRYGEIARASISCCSGSCCGDAGANSLRIGYTEEELLSIPYAANLGLGCGNPTAITSLKEGEYVLDLGSGAGIDCFLAANRVGKKGKVIGVDMTAEMVEKARENARKGNYDQVEFRLGEIENLPVFDNEIDIVISNCVINLSPDKKKVFQEIYRVLKPGGRFMISDTVLLKELPKSLQDSVEAYTGCIAGAIKKPVYLKLLEEAGFSHVKITREAPFPVEYRDGDGRTNTVTDMVASIHVEGYKPCCKS